MGLVLAKKIARAHESKGFVGAIVYGRRGIGKSSYVIKVLKELYANQGLSEDQAYDKAIDTMLFKLNDIIEFVKFHADNGNVAPAICVDDAGVALSRYRWWTDPKEIVHFQAMCDTLRSGVSSMLITCPSPKSVLSFIRKDYDDLFVKITKASGDWRRKAVGYQMFTLPSGKTYVFKNYEDTFSCYLPNRVYEKYERIRQMYLKESMARLAQICGGKARKALED